MHEQRMRIMAARAANFMQEQTYYTREFSPSPHISSFRFVLYLVSPNYGVKFYSLL